MDKTIKILLIVAVVIIVAVIAILLSPTMFCIGCVGVPETRAGAMQVCVSIMKASCESYGTINLGSWETQNIKIGDETTSCSELMKCSTCSECMEAYP